jgi:hypothetical protein
LAESKNETFFPGVRKGLHIDHFVPLASTAGEKRQRIDFSMSLADGQLLGMPEWLTGAVQLVQSGKSKKDVSPVQLDGVTLTCFATDTSDKESIVIPASLLKGFVMQPVSSSEKASGDVIDIELIFSVYLSWNPSVWAWQVNNYNSTFWASFGTAQARLSFGNPKSEADQKKDAEAAEAKARQGSLLPAMTSGAPAAKKLDIPPPAPVEEIPGGDASFFALKDGDPFRYEAARWIKLSSTEAVRQLEPNTRVKFSKAVRVTTGAGGPVTLNEAEHNREPADVSEAAMDLLQDSLSRMGVTNVRDADLELDPDAAHTFLDDGTERYLCLVCEGFPDAPVHDPDYVKPEDRSQEVTLGAEDELPEFEEPTDGEVDDGLDDDGDGKEDDEADQDVEFEDDGLEDADHEGYADHDEDVEADEGLSDADENMADTQVETEGTQPAKKQAAKKTAGKRAAKQTPAKRAAKKSAKRAAKKSAKR